MSLNALRQHLQLDMTTWCLVFVNCSGPEILIVHSLQLGNENIICENLALAKAALDSAPPPSLLLLRAQIFGWEDIQAFVEIHQVTFIQDLTIPPSRRGLITDTTLDELIPLTYRTSVDTFRQRICEFDMRSFVESMREQFLREMQTKVLVVPAKYKAVIPYIFGYFPGITYFRQWYQLAAANSYGSIVCYEHGDDWNAGMSLADLVNFLDLFHPCTGTPYFVRRTGSGLRPELVTPFIPSGHMRILVVTDAVAQMLSELTPLERAMMCWL